MFILLPPTTESIFGLWLWAATCAASCSFVCIIIRMPLGEDFGCWMLVFDQMKWKYYYFHTLRIDDASVLSFVHYWNLAFCVDWQHVCLWRSLRSKELRYFRIYQSKLRCDEMSYHSLSHIIMSSTKWYGLSLSQIPHHNHRFYWEVNYPKERNAKTMKSVRIKRICCVVCVKCVSSSNHDTAYNRTKRYIIDDTRKRTYRKTQTKCDECEQTRCGRLFIFIKYPN